MATPRLTAREKLLNAASRSFLRWYMEDREEPTLAEKLQALKEWEEDPGCGPLCPCRGYDARWSHLRRRAPE